MVPERPPTPEESPSRAWRWPRTPALGAAREQVDERLKSIMRSIHTRVSTVAEEYGQPGNYILGANIAGVLRVATAMLDEDVV